MFSDNIRIQLISSFTFGFSSFQLKSFWARYGITPCPLMQGIFSWQNFDVLQSICFFLSFFHMRVQSFRIYENSFGFTQWDLLLKSWKIQFNQWISGNATHEIYLIIYYLSIMKIIKPDFIKGVWGQTKGMLGMVQTPGKPLKNMEKASFQTQLQQLKHIHFADSLISFLEIREMESIGTTKQFQICEKLGIKTYHYPIIDRSIPNDIQSFAQITKTIVEEEIKKDRVVIAHCFAGLGRTGLFAAACLMQNGFSQKNAMELVRKIRPGTIQLPIQEDFLKKIPLLHD